MNPIASLSLADGQVILRIVYPGANGTRRYTVGRLNFNGATNLDWGGSDHPLELFDGWVAFGRLIAGAVQG